MDPWYYNRLSNAASFQSGTGSSASEYHQQLAGHQAGGNASATPTSTSQLLLQAAAHNSSLPPSPFNPAGFLAPNPYDFPPLFSHASKSSPYAVSQHRALASAMASSKPSESDLPSIRENYNPAHHPTLAATGSPYFEHQNSASSSIGWSHQTSAQLPSPFGILPHESVAAQSSGSSSKASPTDYPFNAYQASHNLAHLSQLTDYKNSSSYSDGKSASSFSDGKSTSSYSDGKSSNSYSDVKKGNRSQSPVSSKTSVPGTAATSFYPRSVGAPNNYGASESDSRAEFPNSGKYTNSDTSTQHQSCIVSSPSVTPSSKDYRMPQSSSRTSSSSTYQDTHVSRVKQTSSRSPNFVPTNTKSSQPQHSVQTKAQSKVYPELRRSTTESSQRSGTPLDTNQSSPVSLSMIDSAAPHRFASEHSATMQAKQLATNTQTQHAADNQTQSYQLALNHHVAAYRHYANSVGAADTDYTRPKSSALETNYNSSSQQSPNSSHSQPSPLGHVPSPVYPMYNSPMASMTSPSQHQHSESGNQCHQNSGNSYKSTTQVNPTAPLDVSITRHQGSQPQNVAYPSVITRALATPNSVGKPAEYNDTRLYDRSQEPALYSKQCWDSTSGRQPSLSEQLNSSSQQGKYQSAANSGPSYSPNTSEMTANISHQQQTSRGSVSASERQHSFYDSTPAHDATLQDLSSCRGDPMSIVKNLQSLQQQTCQAQPASDDSRTGDKASDTCSTSPSKRRKSSEKQSSTPNSAEYNVNRVPPPAHHNISPQQQQNGSYFNYLQPSSSSRSYAGSQTPIHTSNAFVANQHQGLYMSPFFSPFSMPGPTSASAPTASSQSSTSAEFQNTTVSSQTQFSDCAPGSQSTQAVAGSSSQCQDQQTPVEESPKVIVPNIEEELSFLVGPVMMIKSDPERKNNTASGFEASYLKFLQGERETSPPPSNRSVRKITWARTKVYHPEPTKPDTSDNTITNGGQESTAFTSTPAKEKTQVFDPEDDPRYFPLPKTDAQRRSLDSSDSESEPGTINSVHAKNQSSKIQDCKPIAAVAPRTSIKQTAKVSPVTNAQPRKRGRKKKSEVPVPRRETSRRKAKEKGSILLNDGDDDFPDDVGDSDSDPAWTPVALKVKPQNLNSSDEDIQKKKSHKKGCKLTGPGRKRPRNVMSESDDATSDDEKPKKRNAASGPKGRRRSLNMQGSGGNSNSVKSGDDNDEDEIHPFKVGEFVVMKTDLTEKWPPIWRVDGKTLLQKFEPFDKNGEKLYRNISTYSGWSPQNRHIYRSAQVRFRVCNRTETILEFLRDEMVDEDESTLEIFVNETAKYQDNFEVYIQTLISQALDSNFLTEIFQEQDEYFLANVKTIDDCVDDRRKRFLQVVKWRPELEASIATWPCYNVIFELVGDEFHKNCAACDKPNAAARVLLYGQPYNSTTLEGCQADPKLVSEKDFLTCRLCLSRIELYNKVAHQKYLMFIECAKRVNERRLADSSKDTTMILNELLADEKWLNQLFRNVRMSWAQIDRLEQSTEKK